MKNRYPNCGRNSRNAFTLIEVMIAVFIMGIVVAACLGVLRASFLQMETVRNNTLASQILQSEMENMRLQSWGQIATLANGEFEMDEEFAQTHAKNFERRRIVQSVENDMREVTLEVEWTSQNGTTATRRYVTYFAKHGLTDYYYRAFPKE